MDTKIQDIITKEILEEASSEELVQLKKWRSESIHNENLYQEYAAIWKLSANYQAIDFQPKAEAAYQKHLDLLAEEKDNIIDFTPVQSIPDTPKQSSTTFFTLRRLSSIAAIFVMAFGAMFLFDTMGKNTITADGGVMFASLEDGSSIWLDEGSSLTYTRGFGKDHRDVKLDGKAFFDISRNEKVAFNIASNDINVSVLGTSFTVNTKNDKNIVAVKTGKVSVTAQNKSITLLANEKVEYTNQNFVEQETAIEDVNWRNSNLAFSNSPLDQVIADINLFHNNKIDLKNDISNLDCPFTSKSLINTPFDDIVKILEITYDVELEKHENGEVSMTISDCK